MARAKHKAGFSLVEVLCYIMVLSVGINLCGTMFVKSTRMNAAASQTFDRMNGLVEINEAYLETVRAAQGVAEAVGEYESGPHSVVLAWPPDAEGRARYAVLGALRDPRHLSRLVLVEHGGTWKAEKYTTYRLALDAINFGYDTAEPRRARLLRLETALGLDPGEREARRTRHTFVAAPRAHAGRTAANDVEALANAI